MFIIIVDIREERVLIIKSYSSISSIVTIKTLRIILIIIKNTNLEL